MSEKRMALSLTVLEIQKQKRTGGILPPAAGIRVLNRLASPAVFKILGSKRIEVTRLTFRGHVTS